MTRFINSVLISVVAFILFLAVLWQFSDQQPAGDPVPVLEVTGLSPAWGRSDASGSEIVVAATLANHGAAEAHVTAIRYEATVNDETVDSAARDAATRIPPQGEASFFLPLRLPPDFASQWWPRYAAEHEASGLVVRGTFEVEGAGGPVEVPFEWTSTWQGHLADSLGAEPHDCPDGERRLCLETVEMDWDAGRLQARVEVRNPGPDALVVQNASVRVSFGDVAVAAGSMDVARPVAAGAGATVEVPVAFDPDGLDRWWPQHVGRCERSPSSVAVEVSFHVAGNASRDTPSAAPGEPDPLLLQEEPATELRWELAADAFETHLLCARGG